MAKGFSEINRVRRARNAFKNLVEYAQAASIPDAEKVAEQAAEEIHGRIATVNRRMRTVQGKATPKQPEKSAVTKKVSTPKKVAAKTAKPAKATRSTKSTEPNAAAVPRLLEDRTKEQLYSRAQELEIEGRSQMSKDELIEAIRKK